mgnify:CR=1 FL=1
MKLAIIDDSKFWCDLAYDTVKAFYEDNPVDIELFDSGEAFLECNKPYDIILVDINNATKMRTRGVKNNFEYIEYPVYTESHYQAKFSLVDYNEDLGSVDDDCGFAIGFIEP